MAAFQIGDKVELRHSAVFTRGTVIAVHKDTVRVTWEKRLGHDDQTTTESPADLRKSN